MQNEHNDERRKKNEVKSRNENNICFLFSMGYKNFPYNIFRKQSREKLLSFLRTKKKKKNQMGTFFLNV